MTDARLREMEFQISHRHHDGGWGRMEERPEHDSAQHDPERSWSRGRIFQCTSCEDSVTLVPGEEGAPPASR